MDEEISVDNASADQLAKESEFGVGEDHISEKEEEEEEEDINMNKQELEVLLANGDKD